jgi:glycerophosphoryl diester phosphodiesterase
MEHRLAIGGHRGAPDLAPENTMAGFRAAADVGVHYIELDVHRSADGELVVIHDDTVDRTTDGHGPVAQMTVAELKALDAGRRYHPRYAGERIPTLEEVLAWVEGASIGLIIEAKGAGTGGDIAARIVVSAARERLAICSFSADELRAAGAVAAEVLTVLLFEPVMPWGDPVDIIRDCGARGADVPWQWDEPDVVAHMHDGGLAAGGGSANNLVAMERLVRFGADFVDSDVPAFALAARAMLLHA